MIKMAASDWMKTSNQYIDYWIEIRTLSQSIANNNSNVRVDVWVQRRNVGYTTTTSGTVWVKIDGSWYSATLSSVDITSTKRRVFTKTLDINHAPNGTKTLTTSAYFDTNRFTSSEQSYSETLTTIPRYATITSWSITEVGFKRFKINWVTDKAVSEVQYQWNDDKWYVLQTGINASSGSAWVTGIASNSTNKVHLSVKAKDSGLWSYHAEKRTQAQVKLTTVSTPANVTYGVGYISNIDFSIQRANSSVNAIAHVEYYGSSWTHLATLPSIPAGLGGEAKVLNARPNNTFVLFRVRVVSTINGDSHTVYTERFRGNFTASDVKPTSSVEIAIVGSGYDQTIHRPIQNYSKVNVTAKSVSLKYGATIVSRAISFEGITLANDKLLTERSFETDVTKSGTVVAKVTVTDSRGMSESWTSSLSSLAYAAPTIQTLIVDRGSAANSVSLRRLASVAPLTGYTNPFEVVTRYREVGSSAWVNVETPTSKTMADRTFNLPSMAGSKSFEFECYVTDRFYTSATIVRTVGTDKVIWAASENGLGVGKYHEQGALDVGEDGGYFKGIQTIVGESVNAISPNKKGKDFDLITQNGFYHVGVGALNRPPKNNYYNLINLPQTKIAIRYSGHSNQEVWFKTRTTDSNIWDDWVELAGIIDQGANWIRWSDGRQECWISQSVTVTFPSSPNWGSLFTSGGNSIPSVNFPISFAETPVVTSGLLQASANGWLMKSSTSVTKDRTYSMEMVRGTTTSSFTILVGHYAIGRWK